MAFARTLLLQPRNGAQNLKEPDLNANGAELQLYGKNV